MPLMHKLSCSHHTLVCKEQDYFGLKVKFVNIRKTVDINRPAIQYSWAKGYYKLLNIELKF
jgi:hypothetical protein